MEASRVNVGEKRGHGMITEDISSKEQIPMETRKQKIMASTKEIVKRPTNLKELLKTGLLEGVTVLYPKATTNGGDPFRGIIRGCLIRCFCKTCDGKEDVSASNFEKHAGSSNKHPKENIFIDNGNDDGKSLSDVLDACREIEIPALAQTIKNAIGKGQVDSPCSSAASTTSCIEYAYGDPHQQADTLIDDTNERNTLRRNKKHKSGFESLPDGIGLEYYNGEETRLYGVKEGEKIFCMCSCETSFSPTGFENHAGFRTRRNPYLHIRTIGGKSLRQLCKEKKNDKNTSLYQTTDDIACSSSNMLEKTCSATINDVVDPTVEDTEQSDEETSDTQCCVCKGTKFIAKGFGPKTVVYCDQCEREHHVGCLTTELKELPAGEWFCSENCEAMHSVLQKKVNDGLNDLPESLLRVIQQRQEIVGSESDNNLGLKWRIIRGKTASTEEQKDCLTKAESVLHENFGEISFGKIKDLIPVVVRGETEDNKVYSGMYCAVLIQKSEIVCTMIVRIFGEEFAEIPLAATKRGHQGKGYCRSLLGCVENLLASLRVKKIILPAAIKAKKFWKRLAFKNLDEKKLEEYKKNYLLLEFQETTMMRKLVRKTGA